MFARRLIPHITAIGTLALALLLGACDERVSEPGAHLIVPDSLRATVDDSVLIWGVYTGNPADVARYSWDFQSDGIFDSQLANFGEDWEGAGVYHSYSREGDYTVTLQVTTVQNRMLRATTPVRITDELPVISAELPDSVACGESFELVGRASDDDGRRAFWDFGGDGGLDHAVDFTDSVTLTVNASFDEPGIYPMVFGASDNDGHIEKLEFEIVVGDPPSWEGGPAMSEARADHAAAEHGGLLYVFGGRHGRGVVSSLEIYDPALESWSYGADLPTPRWGAEAVAMEDAIYLVGGVTQADTVFPMVEVYHPSTDSWTTFDPDVSKHIMPIAKRGFAALRVGGQTACCDSIMFIGGMAAGAVNDTTMIYYTVNDSFSLDIAPTHFPLSDRTWLDAVTAWENSLQLDGRIFAVGGSEDGANPSARLESYEPEFDYWRNEQAMSIPRIAPAAAYFEGQIYVMGGGDGDDSAADSGEVYSIERRSWVDLPPLLEPRSGAAAVALGGRIYLVGGATAVTSPYHVEGSRDLQILEPWSCSP